MRAGPLLTRAPLSEASSLCTVAAVGAFPLTTTTRTMLFLSRNVSAFPPPRWAQPSGYFREYPAAELRKVKKTWLSGMSPAAVAFASACSADGEAVVAGGAEGVVVVVPLTLGAVVFVELPHPARTRSAARTTAFRTVSWFLAGAEARLNAGGQVLLRNAQAHSPDARERTAPLGAADAEQGSGNHPLFLGDQTALHCRRRDGVGLPLGPRRPRPHQDDLHHGRAADRDARLPVSFPQVRARDLLARRRPDQRRRNADHRQPDGQPRRVSGHQHDRVRARAGARVRDVVRERADAFDSHDLHDAPRGLLLARRPVHVCAGHGRR